MAGGLPEPKYGTDGAFVWITFKRTNSDTSSDTSSDTNSDTNSDTSLNTTQELSDKQKEVLAYCIIARSSREILEHIGVTCQYKNIVKFINNLIDAGYLERTIPDTPNSPQQKYIVKR